MQPFADLPGADDDADFLWHEEHPTPLAAPGPSPQLRQLLPGTVRGRVQIGLLLVPNPGSGLGRLASPLGLTEVNLSQALLASLRPTAAFIGFTRAADLLRLIDNTAQHPQAATGLLLTGLDLLLTRLPATECAQVWAQLLAGPTHRCLVLALPTAFAAYGPADFDRWQQAQRAAVWPG